MKKAIMVLVKLRASDGPAICSDSNVVFKRFERKMHAVFMPELAQISIEGARFKHYSTSHFFIELSL